MSRHHVMREPGTLHGRPAHEDRVAQAFWLREPGCGEIRPVGLPEPGPGEVVVRTVRSGISRGTETLVFRGQVPRSQYGVMRAPFQEGEFPGPVKYGYLSVGVVEHGPRDLRDRTVFCLYPHQTAYVVPAAAVTVVPDGVPPARCARASQLPSPSAPRPAPSTVPSTPASSARRTARASARTGRTTRASCTVSR